LELWGELLRVAEHVEHEEERIFAGDGELGHENDVGDVELPAEVREDLAWELEYLLEAVVGHLADDVVRSFKKQNLVELEAVQLL
jgi:hypothetical protein